MNIFTQTKRTLASTSLALSAVFAFAPNLTWAFDASWETPASDALLDTLKSASSVWSAKAEGETKSAEIIAAVQSDYRTLLGTLYREGYYAPRISIIVDGREGKEISLVALPAKIDTVTLDIDTGPKFTFGTAVVAPTPKRTVLPEGFQSGQTAKSGSVGEAKDIAITAWRDASHAKAALNGQSIIADHNTNTLDVTLEIDPGPKVTFGQLRFAGGTSISTPRLTQITGDIEGSTFNPETFNTISTRLRNTGAFSSVSLTEAETLNPDNSIDILVNVEDAKPRRFGFGAQISSQEGGSLEAYWLHRNISGNADQLRFDGEISGLGSTTGVDYILSASYRRPATTRPVLTLIVEADIARLDEPGFISNTAGITVSAEVEISKKSYFSGGIGYRYSDVDDDFGERTFSHVILPLEASRDTRDDKLNPTSGTYHSASLIPFIGVGDSESGARLFTDSRAYKALDEGNKFVLAARISAGSVLGTDLSETPPDYLFYSGGSGTVRGQPYNSLGVEFGDDLETGGAGFIGFSTELRAALTETLSLVSFYDLGGVSAGSTPGSDATFHSGAGLGLRYNTGFGPIRFDVGAPVSGPTGDGLQFYVGIGQAF